MLAFDRGSRTLDASMASTSTFHAIPAFGQFNMDRRVSANGFDSVMADVDKHHSFSARRTVGAREGTLTLKSALLYRNESEQRFPPSMISFDKVPVHSPTGALHSNVDTLHHHHHHATILVLESFFDGIDDHVDVRQEVWDYDRSLVSSVHAG
jgi:hypothetical protein